MVAKPADWTSSCWGRQTRLWRDFGFGERLTNELLLRLATVLTALLIVYIRMPINLTHPQFWGEDAIFFAAARTDGWLSAFASYAGYMTLLTSLTALIGSYLPATSAAAFHTYAALSFTMLVVWLTTSPRLDLPNRPLAALAVVAVPGGYEVLGNLPNVQWILPIGAFTLLFMRPSGSALVLAGEALFLAGVMLTGPMGLFLAPLFVWRLMMLRGGPMARRRMQILTAIALVGAAIVSLQVLTQAHHAFQPGLAENAYTWHLWFNLPLYQITGIFGSFVQNIFTGWAGLLATCSVALLVLRLATREPYQAQKTAMIAFAALIIVSAMLKYRQQLDLLVYAGNQRYFYAGSIFALWFISCIPKTGLGRKYIAFVVAFIEAQSVFAVRNTPRVLADQEWPVWASHISSGLPVTIPTAPGGWSVSVPARSEGGPLAKYNAWLGKKLDDLAVASSACAGAFESATRFLMPGMRGDLWLVKGWASDQARSTPLRLIVIVNSEKRVVGFAFPGFKASPGSPSPSRAGWSGILPVGASTRLRAYGILRDRDELCLLENEQRAFAQPAVVPSGGVDVFLGRFSGAVHLTAGSRIVQRFKPAAFGLKAVLLQFVTWTKTPTSYVIKWKVTALKDGIRRDVANGELAAEEMFDWQTIALSTPSLTFVAEEVQIELLVPSGQDSSMPAGVPLFAPAAPQSPIEINGVAAADGSVLGIKVLYDRP